MIIHGTEDKMIPIEHSAALLEAIPQQFRAEPFWVMGKGHNDMDYNFEPFIQRVKEFLSDNFIDYKDRMEKKGKKKRRSDSKRSYEL